MLLNVTVDTTRDAATLLPSTSLTGPPGRTRSRLSRRAPARSRVRLRTARHRVSVVESGGKIRYHARARSRGGREIDVSAGQRVLRLRGYHPGVINRGPGYHPGVVKRSLFVPQVHILAAGGLVDVMRIVHVGHKRRGSVESTSAWWRGGEITPG